LIQLFHGVIIWITCITIFNTWPFQFFPQMLGKFVLIFHVLYNNFGITIGKGGGCQTFIRAFVIYSFHKLFRGVFTTSQFLGFVLYLFFRDYVHFANTYTS
jgi:hypothetical protein